MLAWQITVKPLDTIGKQYLENANEFLVLILGYFGFLFTGYVGDPIYRHKFGYLYLGLLAAGLIINLIFAVYTTIKDLIHFHKYYRSQIRRLLNLTKQQKSPEPTQQAKKRPK